MVCNSHCIPTLNFIPRYFDCRPHDGTIEDNHIAPEPFLQSVMTSRAFMPSVDFSRTGSPPRPLPDAFPYVRASSFENFFSSHAGRTPYPSNFQQAGVQVPLPNEDERVLKPMKLLLTFGAQVPSCERVPLSSLKCGYLSSPSMEIEAPVFGQHERLKPTTNPNASRILPPDPTKEEDEIKPKTDSVAPSSLVVQEIVEDTSNHVEKPEKPFHFVDTLGVQDKDDSISSKTEDNFKNISTRKLSPTNQVIEPSQPNSASASLLDNIANKCPKLPESSTAPFGLARTRSLRLCTCAQSDGRLSTLTEKTSDSKQPVESPQPDVISPLDPHAAVAPHVPQAEQELRFQLVEKENAEEFKQKKHCPETEIKAEDSAFVDDPLGIQSRCKSLEMPHGVISITEVCDESSALYETSEPRRPFSDFRSSCTDSTTYQVSTGYRYTNGETSLTENGASCLDDSRVSSLPQSVNFADTRQRFQSAISNLGARRHIALQCELPGKISPESAFLGRKTNAMSPILEPQQVRHKDACIQVPVLCCQSVETERYTTEKGVPECRAGLTLRLKSTVVDVPPVVKMTETVGISTERLTNEEACQATEDWERKPSCKVEDEMPCPTKVDDGLDCRRPLVQVSTSQKRLKRLKPFFRSHCNELANICALAAVPLRSENSRISHQNPQLNRSSKRDAHGSSFDEHRQYDRRRNFRMSKGESGIQTSGSSHYRGGHLEPNRTAGVQKIDPPTVKDHQPGNSHPSRRAADVTDRKHSRSVGREDRAGCRRKAAEPSKVNRPSTGSADYEKPKRKPSCAVCRKERYLAYQKRVAMKDKKAERNTPNIRRSLMNFGLSNIITPVENFESPAAESKELVNTNDSYDEFQRSSSRSDDECLESLTFQASNSYKPAFKEDVYVDFASSPVVLVNDGLALNQPRKDVSRDMYGNADSGPSFDGHKSKRTSVGSRSTVPTIYLTRADSNDVPGAEDSSIFAPPVQVGFISLDTAIRGCSLDRELEAAPKVMPLKESNSTVDVSAKQPAPTFVDSNFKNTKDANVTCAAQTPEPPEETTFKASSFTNTEEVEASVTEESEEDASTSTDHGIDKETSSPNQDEKASAENRSSDSEFYPEPSIGCVFTAMRRYMKCHQRPERTSKPAYWNKCPGFHFAGVPANENDSVRKRGYPGCCNCALSGLDSSPGTPAEVGLLNQRCSKGPAISQQYDLDEDVRDSSNMPDKPKVIPLNTKILWQSVLRRSTSRQITDVEDDSKFIRKDAPKTLQDIVSSLRYVKGEFCRDSSEKEEPVEDLVHTMPPDKAPAEDFRLRYPRCASALPECSEGARRRPPSASGEVRIRHSRCWSSDHSSLRRYLRDVPRIPAEAHYRTARRRTSCADSEAFGAEDAEDKHNVFCYRWNQ